MHIVLVHIHVKPEAVDPFIQATLNNATNSAKEPGVVRFDFFQQKEDPTRFTLVEIYTAPEEQEKHRQTTHYLNWRDTVGDMMAETRVGVRYTNVFPTDQEWR